MKQNEKFLIGFRNEDYEPFMFVTRNNLRTLDSRSSYTYMKFIRKDDLYKCLMSGQEVKMIMDRMLRKKFDRVVEITILKQNEAGGFGHENSKFPAVFNLPKGK